MRAAPAAAQGVAAKKVQGVVGWGTDKTDVGPEDFDLLKVIGRGSFGKVMLVTRKGQTNIYAMKILRKEAIIARNQASDPC